MQLTVASGKGGVGKSSITASLSFLLSKSVKLVSLDADADTPNLEILLKVKSWEGKKPFEGERIAVINPSKCIGCGICAEHCPYECIYPESNYYKISEILCEGCNVCSMVCPEKETISFKPTIPGFVKWGKTIYGFPLVTAELLPGRPNSGKLVFEAKKIAKNFDHDLLLIDAAAGIGCSVIASINGSDYTIVVVEPTEISFSDAKRLLKITDHFKVKTLAVINKFNVNEEYSKRLEEFFTERNIRVIGKIPYDKSVVEALVKGEPAIKTFPDSPFSKAVKKVAENLKEIL
ncbi:MinD superfamily P-loop ATPase, contains an inserted ferredoxin domain [Desulfurobacterium pacificum]|uniref:MinD superfamily P-loop ATPase, contains an inserted ferredoxin domain n=1 Tax=Desulfurobacterium pacificum TaxID=240166 RepID=A0ABY1NCH9_9BACT|nr:ATP-binding protein [Desulfurobacterium pacificum]SMP06294.1 MinD superfamily P-loop ATPase, contains an inserted ferredoxin domain [Desulfurobacterium pacificum]